MFTFSCENAAFVLERFFELAPDLICVAGRDGRFHHVSESVRRVLGHGPEELSARPFWELIHLDDRARARAEMMRLAAGVPAVRFECRFRRFDGDYADLEWNAIPSPDDDLIFAVARDLTESRRADRRSRAFERRESAILNNTPAVIYVKDQHGRYQFINQRFETLFRISLREIIGKTDLELFDTTAAEAFWKNDRTVLDSGQTIQVTEQAPHADGMHTYLTVKFPLRDADDRVYAVAGISTDMTDRIRAEETECQLNTARMVQNRLFPAHTPQIPRLDIAAASIPLNHLCGDYYDYIPRGEKEWCFAVGDVSGHDLAAALQMVETRALLRTYVRDYDLAEAVRRLNETLVEDIAESAFVTLFLLTIDRERGSLTYVGAGHDAWIVRADGSVVHLESTGMALGILAGETYEVASYQGLETGDLVLLLTDGIYEAGAVHGRPLGVDAAIDRVRCLRGESAGEIVRDLFSSAARHIEPHRHTDDLTAMVIQAVA